MHGIHVVKDRPARSGAALGRRALVVPGPGHKGPRNQKERQNATCSFLHCSAGLPTTWISFFSNRSTTQSRLAARHSTLGLKPNARLWAPSFLRDLITA